MEHRQSLCSASDIEQVLARLFIFLATYMQFVICLYTEYIVAQVTACCYSFIRLNSQMLWWHSRCAICFSAAKRIVRCEYNRVSCFSRCS